MALKENYKDDILDVSVNTKRKYRVTENQDGTVSLEDETVYTQQGDSFGASDMNATNGKVNTLETDIGEINDNLTDKVNKLSGVTGYQTVDFIGYDATNKKLGLKVGGADTVIPFSQGYSFCGFAKNRGYNATIFSCVDGVIRSSTSSITTDLFTLSASGYTVNITLRKKVDAVWMNSNGRTSTSVGTYNSGQSFALCNYDGDGQGGVFIIKKVY